MKDLSRLLVLAVCASISPIGLFILAPALPAIRDSFSASLAETQMIIAVYSVALAFSMLACGPLAERYNKKALLIAGMGVFSLGALLAYVAPNMETLISARVLQGIGAASASIVPRAIVAETYKGDDLNRAMSVIIIFMVIGPLAAPATAGVIVDLASWRAVMLLLLSCCAISTLTAVFLIKGGDHVRDVAPLPMIATMREQALLFRNRKFMTNMTVLVAIQIAVYLFLAASPYIVIERLGFSPSVYGATFVFLTSGYISGNFLTGAVVKRFGGVQLIFWAACAYMAGVAILAGFYGAGVETLASLVGPVVILTCANGITQPNCTAGALSSVDERKGAAASLSGFGQVMAAALGAQLSAVAGAGNLVTLLSLMFVFGLAALAAAFMLIAEDRNWLSV